MHFRSTLFSNIPTNLHPVPVQVQVKSRSIRMSFGEKVKIGDVEIYYEIGERATRCS